MKYIFKDIAVDTAMIFVCDKQFLIQNGATNFKKFYGRIIKKQPGIYSVDIRPLPVPRSQCKTEEEFKIDADWCMKVRTKGKISVETGNVFVGDPCYYFDQNNWMKFINKYYTFDKTKTGHVGKFDKNGRFGKKSCVQLSLDADGNWDVELNLMRIRNTD